MSSRGKIVHDIQVYYLYKNENSFKRFQDLTVDQFREIRAKAGGIIILLPENVSILSSEEKLVTNLYAFISFILIRLNETQ